MVGPVLLIREQWARWGFVSRASPNERNLQFNSIPSAHSTPAIMAQRTAMDTLLMMLSPETKARDNSHSRNKFGKFRKRIRVFCNFFDVFDFWSHVWKFNVKRNLANCANSNSNQNCSKSTRLRAKCNRSLSIGNLLKNITLSMENSVKWSVKAPNKVL